MIKVRTCKFCGQEYQPRTEGQIYCSTVCRRASFYVESIKGRERAREERDFEAAQKRKKEGLVMCICQVCLRSFFALPGTEFCSNPCEQLYAAQDPHNGQKLPRDAVSMLDLIRK